MNCVLYMFCAVHVRYVYLYKCEYEYDLLSVCNPYSNVFLNDYDSLFAGGGASGGESGGGHNSTVSKCLQSKLLNLEDKFWEMVHFTRLTALLICIRSSVVSRQYSTYFAWTA